MRSKEALERSSASSAFEGCGPRLQNWSLRPNWMTRADSPVWMMVCVEGGATVAQQVCAKTLERMLGLPTEASRGLSKFGWFRALNISVRNCTLNLSVSENILTKLRSRF